MYAIIEEGGQQFKVEEGQEFEVDYRQLAAGEQLTFNRVLAFRDDRGLHIGQPTLDSASVVAEVVGPAQGKKLTVQKFRRRKNSRTKTGHRQLFTRIRIQKIDVAGPE